jgi:hypothetical protein
MNALEFGMKYSSGNHCYFGSKWVPGMLTCGRRQEKLGIAKEDHHSQSAMLNKDFVSNWQYHWILADIAAWNNPACGLIRKANHVTHPPTRFDSVRSRVDCSFMMGLGNCR